MSKILPILVLICVYFPFSSIGQSDTCLNYTELGLSFPPTTGSVQRDFTKPHMDILGVKKLRFEDDWYYREPVQGYYNWGDLDSIVNWAERNGFELMLSIPPRGPDWACTSQQNEMSCVFADNEDFNTYLDTLFSKYSGVFPLVQFANEWESQWWYIGSAAQFIATNNAFYQAVKENSPSSQVVLGGFTTMSLRIMSACNGYVSSFNDDEGNIYGQEWIDEYCDHELVLALFSRIDSVLSFANYDMLDLHLYHDVDQWDEYYACFSDTISKPIIVSEFGGPNINMGPSDDEYQAQCLYRYIKKLDSLQIPEAYFFKLVAGSTNPNGVVSNLIDSTLNEKESYFVFQAFEPCITDVQIYNTNLELSIYPNPTISTINIESNHKIESVLIYNQYGQIVDTRASKFIDMETLPKGVYFLKICFDNECAVRKILKM